jgi:hypothetical protein
MVWIVNDYRANRMRFIVETLAWAMSIGCSLTMTITMPNPPFLALYPFWITGCLMYAWAAYSRRSFGMLANYLLLTLIDIVGYARFVYS